MSVETQNNALTVEEAAKLLGYKPNTVYKKVRLKVIVARKYGRDVRIFPEDNTQLFKERQELQLVDAKG